MPRPHRGSVAIPGTRALSPRPPPKSAPPWQGRRRIFPDRLLLSAHGLPKRTIQRGDPYQWQVEQSAAAIVNALGDARSLNRWSATRAGSGRWNGSAPSTDAEIRRAGRDKQGRHRRAHRLCQRAFRNPGGTGYRISPPGGGKRRAGLSPRRHGGHPSGFHRRAGRPCAASAGRRNCHLRRRADLSRRAQSLRLRRPHDGHAAQRACQLHPLDHRLPHHRGDRLDVGHALSAAPVRVSHRDAAGLGSAASASR